MHANPPPTARSPAIPLTAMSLIALLFFIFLSSTNLPFNQFNSHPGLIAGISDLVVISSQESCKNLKPANNPGSRIDGDQEPASWITHQTRYQLAGHTEEKSAAADRQRLPRTTLHYLHPPLRAPPVV